jgi:ABC-type uncharacterized transport system substrate-binding protein
LLALAPDVILANGDPAARTMQQSSRTVPVIFISGSAPVADGLVLSLGIAITAKAEHRIPTNDTKEEDIAVQ